MKILLLSMPDSFEHTPALTMRFPNGALASLAGNVDPHHTVSIADLILAQRAVRETVTRFVTTLQPDVVGLSIMTFQRKTARKVIALVKALRPSATVVVGGYDPSLAPEAYTDPESGVDVIVHGEGDITFRELVRAVEAGRPAAGIDGLSYREGGRFVRPAPRAVTRLETGDVRLPNRAARVLGGYTMMGRPVDVVETSRGCTYDCSFCSIIEMRGRNFHTWGLDRVIADIADARARGAGVIFLVDDNIVLNVRRFEALCQAIIAAGLNDVDYTVQAMTSTLANHGATLAPLMRRAGFRYVFLGIENVLEEDLEFLRARRKNTKREGGRSAGNAALDAIRLIHQHGMYVVGGLIVGNPDDTRASIDANLQFARQYVDWPYIQHPMPYPGTPMTRDFRERDLIVSEAAEEYDGTTAVVRTRHLSRDEVAFLRWRAERWMKVRHMPAAFRHDPSFVLRNAYRMAAHTFRGSTWRTWLGLEDERRAFQRYSALREREREYLADVPVRGRMRDTGEAPRSQR